MNLFEEEKNTYRPLADKMRPTNLDEFFGQENLVGKGAPIREMINNDNISSMIFWGPPGTGKTTLAKIIANETNSSFYELSAVTSGVKEIKEIVELANYNKLEGKRTILFVDEIHRFNKAQQDAFLPHVESGNIILIGATTENPSFEVNSALLSRSKVYVLKSLTTEELIGIQKRAIEKEYPKVVIDDISLSRIANISNGDARTALNTLENVINLTPTRKGKKTINEEALTKSLQNKIFLYDKDGEEHYNLISALHKSMRNSDPDAALYYLARMLESGEDPLYIARRLIRFASEDVGLANPNALVQAISAYEASHYIGVPECSVNLSQAVVYLSMSPKSNSLEVGYMEAAKDARDTAALKVPLHLRNAVTKLDENLGYGKGYEYAHNLKEKMSGMTCLPEPIKDHTYYHPTNSGNEKAIQESLERINKIKEGLRKKNE